MPKGIPGSGPYSKVKKNGAPKKSKTNPTSRTTLATDATHKRRGRPPKSGSPIEAMAVVRENLRLLNELHGPDGSRISLPVTSVRHAIDVQIHTLSALTRKAFPEYAPQVEQIMATPNEGVRRNGSGPLPAEAVNSTRESPGEALVPPLPPSMPQALVPPMPPGPQD